MLKGDTKVAINVTRLMRFHRDHDSRYPKVHRDKGKEKKMDCLILLSMPHLFNAHEDRDS